MNRIYFIFFTLIISSCYPKKNDKSVEVLKIDVVAKDIRIPKVIFENIASDMKAESLTSEPVYLFYPLEVTIEVDGSSSNMKSAKYLFSNGGGVVDLSSNLKGQASFYVYFPEEQFEKLPPLEHLYFLSEYPQKKIDGEIFGLGCAKWIDLKSKFSELTKAKTKLNTTDQRYLYVAGGYYIFVFRKANQVYLTHLHLTDSKYADLKCPDQIEFKSETINEHN